MKRNPTQDVDNIDLQIIKILQEDARFSHRTMASKLNIAVGTSFNRVKRLEETGVLKRFTVVIDPVKVGYGLTAVILAEVNGKNLLDIEEEIAKMSNVLSVYNTTGEYNIAITARFKDKPDLDYFINNLTAMPFITRTVVNIALNVIKEDFRINI